MSGFQEILLLVALVLAIFFLPRVLPARNQQATPRRGVRPISGRMRLALVASAVWPAAVAAYIQPWKTDLPLFLYAGLGPVAIGWALWWIRSGYRNSRKRF